MAVCCGVSGGRFVRTWLGRGVTDENDGVWGRLSVNSFDDHSAVRSTGCTGVESVERWGGRMTGRR